MIEKFLYEKGRKYIGINGIEDVKIVTNTYNSVLYEIHFVSKELTYYHPLDIMDVMKGSDLDVNLTETVFFNVFDEYIKMRHAKDGL